MFRFYNPVKIISDERALDSLAFELRQLGAARPLVVTDPGVTEAGLVDLVMKTLADGGGITAQVFDRVPQDSSVKIVDAAAEVFRRNSCDALVAVGGGSVIDTAKAVNILVTEGENRLAGIVGRKLRKAMMPLVVIPTTSGTGSEVTYAAMIRDVEKNRKILFASFLLLPRTAILDPRMTLSLPPLITAATAMDALTHAIEACICKSKNPFSDAHAKAAIALICQNLPKVLKDGRDSAGRLCLANAACMAGAAFSNSGVGLIHALGHALGGVCHVPHGIAMNIFLPFGLEFNIPGAGETIGELLMPLAGPEVYVKTPPDARAEKTVAVIREMRELLYETTALPRTLQEAGVSKDSLEDVARLALEDPAIQLNPSPVGSEDALKIVKHAC